MLKKLSIRNFVLIDSLEFSPADQLTILTGETGAGKSILLGALGLLLGQRADSAALLDKKQKCIIEGQFDIRSYQLNAFFAEQELDYDDLTTIRREINAEGKSRAFVNDTPVNLSTLKLLTSNLVDIHSQHENLLLQDNQFQMRVLDGFAENKTLLSQYKNVYTAHEHARRQLLALEEEESKGKADYDYFQFQFRELAEANLIPGETLSLETELKKITHAADLLRLLSQANAGMQEGESGVLQLLRAVQQLMTQAQKFDPTMEDLVNRLKSIAIEASDIAAEIEKAESVISPDPNRQAQIEERLDQLYKLQHKHRLQSEEELISLQAQFEAKIEAIESIDRNLEQHRKELQELHKELTKIGNQLTKSRQEAIPGLEKELMNLFASLAMPNAQVRIALIPHEEQHFTALGFEQISFLFSANRGGEFREIAKVASGGELSRVMLCIKAILARKTALPTIIFDEVDAGVSGETASKMGNILEAMAKHHQVLVITHLPQIASRGQAHYRVFKEQQKTKTRTGLQWLDNDERINEIARLLSGEKLSDAAIGNAKELLALN